MLRTFYDRNYQTKITKRMNRAACSVGLLLVCLFSQLRLSLTRCAYTETKHLFTKLERCQDPRIRPHPDGPPVNVSVSLHVASFGSISEVNMDYTMDVYFRQYWVNPELQYNESEHDVKKVTITSQAMGKFWTPDLYFLNEKKGAFHDVTLPNRLLKIYPNGTVTYSTRLTLTLACPMDLSYFPLDRQECELDIGSYSYATEDLNLRWTSYDTPPRHAPISVISNIQLPQFQLEEWGQGQCRDEYTDFGKYPCLRVVFKLRREIGFYVLQTFVPTVLIVFISWISFWINSEAVAARISLGVTTVLTMITQLSGSKVDSPRVSYPKALDIWMTTCMVFVFTAMLEFALVNSYHRKKSKRVDAKAAENNYLSAKKDLLTEATDIRRNTYETRVPGQPRELEWDRRLDKYSRVLFPILFILFNFVFFLYYLLKGVKK